MNEQPRERLNAADPSPYVIFAMIAVLVVLIVGGGAYYAYG